MTEIEQAVDRVRRAGMKARDVQDVSAILDWIRAVKPENILKASLREIRAVAGAF